MPLHVKGELWWALWWGDSVSHGRLGSALQVQGVGLWEHGLETSKACLEKDLRQIHWGNIELSQGNIWCHPSKKSPWEIMGGCLGTI